MIKFFSVDVNGHTDKDPIIKGYVENNKKFITSTGNTFQVYKGLPLEFQGNQKIEQYANSNNPKELAIISDLIRYYYLRNEGGIYLDTDLELFGVNPVLVLIDYYNISSPERSFVILERLRNHRLGPCNWLMVSKPHSKLMNGLFNQLYSAIQNDTVDDVVGLLWGSLQFKDIPMDSYQFIRTEWFQGYTYDCDWRTPNLSTDHLFGCHHFGSRGAELRPKPEEFEEILEMHQKI